jgi:hypothetical protein
LFKTASLVAIKIKKKNTVIDQIEKTDIETDIGKRWEEGIPHHPKAEELSRIIGELDFLYADDSFCFKFGGDGDNSETLTYLLDIFFEFKDKTGFKLGRTSS